MRFRLLALLLLLLPPLAGSAEQVLLGLRVWCELEPMVQENQDYPLSREEAHKRVLEEARAILSGMLYGFRFSYTPSDSTRKIPEEFSLTPVAEIAWSDPRLRIADAYVQDSLLFVKVYYDLEDFQIARRRAWSSNAISSASGLGEHSVFTAPGPEGKRRALQEALKNAIRAALRPVRFNKPREISGEILIWSEPRTIIQAGAYVTELNVKLRIKEIRSYSLF